MNRAADPKRVRRFFVSGGTERFSASAGGTFRLRRGCGAVCRRGRGESRRRRRGRMRPPLFCARRGGAAFRVGRCVGMSLFKGAAAFPLDGWVAAGWCGWLKRRVRQCPSFFYVRAVAAGHPLPCGCGAGPDRTGCICPPPSALRPRWSGSGAVSRGREPNNGSGITFYGRKSSDFSK